MVFLEDEEGNPGIPIAEGDQKIGPAFSRIPTGGQLLNGVTTPYEYAINLHGGITLSPDTTFWISITNDLLPTSGWSWARANGVLDSEIAATLDDITTGPWSVGPSNGMWFQLNDHIIPEPSSLITLLVALMTNALLCARQRKNMFVLCAKRRDT